MQPSGAQQCCDNDAGLEIWSATYDVKSASVLLDIRQDRHCDWEEHSGCSLQGVGRDPVTGRNLCFTARLPVCSCW
jgi:hypothetical protein